VRVEIRKAKRAEREQSKSWDRTFIAREIETKSKWHVCLINQAKGEREEGRE
jgi:hypothetical protein